MWHPDAMPADAAADVALAEAPEAIDASNIMPVELESLDLF